MNLILTWLFVLSSSMAFGNEACDELIGAAYKGEIEEVTELLRAGVDVNCTDKHEETPLMASARYGRLEIAKILIQSGAKINQQKKKNGYTALITASITDANKEKKPTMVKFLIKSKANIELQTHDGVTALMAASISSSTFGDEGSLESMKILIQAGAKLDNQSIDGSTALFHAVNCPEAVQLLIEAGANVNQIKKNGITSLMEALNYRGYSSNSETIDLLIKAGANIEFQNNLGITALMIARDENDAMALISAGAKLNVQSKSGKTALLWAVEKEQEGKVKALIKAGANLNLTDYDGVSALQLARVLRFEDIEKLLIEAGAAEI